MRNRRMATPLQQEIDTARERLYLTMAAGFITGTMFGVTLALAWIDNTGGI